MKIIQDTKSLEKLVQSYKESGKKVSLVPTMGALHEGHISLLEIARKNSDRVIASIFVNPTQFGKNEDFSKYPRRKKEDIDALKKAGTDAVFLPAANVIYPEGFKTSVSVKGFNEVLCGKFRQGHFDGVATVVTKLFMLAKPDVAVFGEKDWQQLQVIKTLVRDLNLPVKIISGKTLRETNGLAKSSRNVYLSREERKIAAKLSEIMNESRIKITGGKDISATTRAAEKKLLSAGFSKIDYFTLCEPETLKIQKKYKKPARLIAAVWLGKTRLIDNIEV